MYISEDGIVMPQSMIDKAMPAKSLKLQLAWMKSIEIRENDVIICAYPKTGTHWLWEVLSMIRNEKAEYDIKVKENAMLEFQTPEVMAKLPSPRVLNTHFLPRHLPVGITEKKCKIIHVKRNPKDVVVSKYHQILALPDLWDHQEPSFEDHLKNTTEKEMCAPCSIFEYYKEYEMFRKENPDQVLNVYYESMKKQPEMEIKRIAEFTGQTVDESLVKEIATMCDFSNLKQANLDMKIDMLKDIVPGGSAFAYRKGVIGDWKNHFTVAENEAYDQIIDNQFKDTGLVFQYE